MLVPFVAASVCGIDGTAIDATPTENNMSASVVDSARTRSGCSVTTASPNAPVVVTVSQVESVLSPSVSEPPEQEVSATVDARRAAATANDRRTRRKISETWQW